MRAEHIDTRDKDPLPDGRRRLLVAAMIGLLPLVILVGVWRLGGVSALEDDLIYYLPVRQYIGERIAAGEWPLWNPLIGMGTSIAADPQSGLWYPPTWIFAVLPPLLAYPVTLFLHYVLAGAGMYRLLRSLGRHWQAALLGAIAFEFSGYLVAHRAHLTIHHAAAWMPLIFFAWQRFSATGCRRHFAVAVLALGLQMLVQHIQVTIVTLALLGGYILFVLRPMRPSLLYQFPAGVFVAALLSAVQWLPTMLHLGSTGRATPSYALFVENSWVPTSSLLLMFPMLFGTRTPNIWDQPWWGVSHFCEQSAYGAVLILVLAVASAWLLRGYHEPVYRLSSPHVSGHELRGRSTRPWNREVLFWWLASLAVLLLALGEFTPLGNLLFHIPVYRNLRVPARWILGWSMAMPILASAVVSAVLSRREAADRAAGGVRFAVKRFLPAAIMFCVCVMAVARWQADRLRAMCEGLWNADVIFAGLRSAITPANPAIWWPILLAVTTGWLLVRWVNLTHVRRFSLLFVIMIIDLAAVAAFVDVDTRTYTSLDLGNTPSLAQAFSSRSSGNGERLLVPRTSADYARPIEVLWPQTNIRHEVPTLNSYGPLSPLACSLLLRFLPWGNSEVMLLLLRHPRLLPSLGVRYLAARTEQERGLIEAASWPDNLSAPLSPIAGTENLTPVVEGSSLFWPVKIDTPGIYELTFDAQGHPGETGRWFVRLETEEYRAIESTRTLTPEDLAAGARRMRFQFRCDKPEASARVSVKAERGSPLSAGRAVFGKVASPPPGNAATSTAVAAPPLVWKPVADLPSGVSLYETPRGNPLFFWAKKTTAIENINLAVDLLLAPQETPGDLADVVVDRPLTDHWPDGAPPGLPLLWLRVSGHEIRVSTENSRTALLVFNETSDSGWKATVDGRASPVIRVNAVAQGVVVPVGRHDVVWKYRPRGLILGIALSGGGLLLLFILGLPARPNPA